VALLASSGHAALDEETLALLERASPLPGPPPGAGAGPVEIAVPVQYRLR
jgi:protein TonB